MRLRHRPEFRAPLRSRLRLAPSLCSCAAWAALLLVFFAGCGDDPASPPAGEGAPPAFRVALLTPGSISDGGWNGGAYEGLRLIRDELGAQISHIETKTPAEFEESFRDYGSRGYDLVFGHGFEYQDAAAVVAPEYVLHGGRAQDG
jgi:basic membrane lipoprotein Med (substrate-binding protein (PBP1-ABC) superfamily)